MMIKKMEEDELDCARQEQELDNELANEMGGDNM